MLLWQRKNAPKLSFTAQLGFVILLMHAVALLLLCMFSVGVHDELQVISSHSYVIGADIIVVPFKKTIKSTSAQPAQPVVQEVKQHTTIVKEVQQSVQKKPISEPQKKEPVKLEQLKPEPEKAPIKELEKPAELEPKAAEKIASLPVASAPSVQKSVAQPTPTPAEPPYIGTRQMQTMHMQHAIVEQVHMHWHPPEGLDPDLEVVLVVHLAHNGEVTEIDTQQSSGVFVYDVHARSAVYEMQFPKSCWGRSVTISFR